MQPSRRKDIHTFLHTFVHCPSNALQINNVGIDAMHLKSRYDSTSGVVVLATGVRGAHELPVLGATADGPYREGRVIPRYPVRARYFRFLVASGNVGYLLRGNSQIDIIDRDGLVRTVVRLPSWPRDFDVRFDTSFTANELVALRLITDGRGNLWIERPRHNRVDRSVWLIVNPDGILLGETVIRPECALLAVGTRHLVCEERNSRAGQQEVPVFSVYSYAVSPSL